MTSVDPASSCATRLVERDLDRADVRAGDPAQPQVVATDLDGTLLRSDGTVGARSVGVLRRLADLGVRLVFVTGRPPATAAPIADEVGHTGLAICSNGAVVVDLAGPTPRPVRVFTLAAEVVSALVEVLGVDVPGTSFGVQHTARFVCEQTYPYDPGFPAPETVPTAAELVAGGGDPPIKLVVRHHGMDGDGLLRVCRQSAERAGLAERAEFTISGPAGFVEIAAAGVSKASTLAGLCADWAVPRERVVAFGDMPNDVEMLAWAGRSFAMPHAHVSAAAAAGEVAPADNDADGVAMALADIFGLEH